MKFSQNRWIWPWKNRLKHIFEAIRSNHVLTCTSPDDVKCYYFLTLLFIFFLGKPLKQKKCKKTAWIPSHHLHLQWKFKLVAGMFNWGNKAKHLSTCQQSFCFQSLLTAASNVLPLHLKQTFPPIIWLFTEGEGDRTESRLPFKIF